MATLNGLIDLAMTAMQASQGAINITSSNVANVNTPGYVQETANFTEQDVVSLGGNGSDGTGVSVSADPQRDRVLEQRVQQQTQVESSSAAESSALSQLEDLFGLSANDSSSSTSTLGTDINSFFNSLSALQASPADSSTRQAVLSAAQTLASDFNSAASQISQQTSGMNQQVTGIVGQVNSLTSSIAKLNTQIEQTSPNGDAGTLEDQRQQDLSQLSQLIGFNTTTTENNGITLTTTNGAVLVDQGQSFALSAGMSGGNVDVYSTSPTTTDITSGLTGGQLGGVLTARDQDLPNVMNELDTLAYAIGSQVNTQNAAGLDANGNAGAAIFSLPTSATGAAGSIAVTMTDPNGIAAAATGEGTSGSSNAKALSGLGSSAIVDGETPAAYMASFLTQLGTTVSTVSNDNTVQQGVLTQLTTQRDALSSVSLDQQAASLTQYENAYQAAAKVFSVIDTLFASALNLGVETAVN